MALVAEEFCGEVADVDGVDVGGLETGRLEAGCDDFLHAIG